MKKLPIVGDYVLATKWKDGDPEDHFCVGHLERTEADFSGRLRFFVVDKAGNQFRENGFRRCERISSERGAWLVNRLREIESSGRSVWWWKRAPMTQT